MLMVIFGAGASYDSSSTYTPGQTPPTGSDEPNYHHRLPLANELFQNRPLFMEWIDRFPQCRSIVPKLRDQTSIEAILQQLYDESQSYPRGRQELLAVRCYIHGAISDCQERWRGVTRRITNYLSLLREIDLTHRGDESVRLVTFNYDTLLEDALEDLGCRITTMEGYVRNPFFRLFKVHGSVNWAQIPSDSSRITGNSEVIHRMHTLGPAPMSRWGQSRIQAPEFPIFRWRSK